MWMHEKALEIPVQGLFNNKKSMCILASNARLDNIMKVLLVIEHLDDDAEPDDMVTGEEREVAPKTGKIPRETGKKRKPGA